MSGGLSRTMKNICEEMWSVKTPTKGKNAVDDLSQIKWLYDGSKVSSLNKADYINLLKNNSGFNSEKVINIFSDYARSLGKPRFTTQAGLENFITTNDQWFLDVFKIVN
jgi:hypothetical protein